MNRKPICEITVKIGNDDITSVIRFSTRREPITSRLLGADTDSQGNIERMYFDSLFHNNFNDVDFHGWEPSGCISTILTRKEPVRI